MRLCSVSVDLDEIPAYFQIHGIPLESSAHLGAVYDLALGRLTRWAKALGIPLTLFVVGRDLGRPEVVTALKRAVDDRFEIASHSFSHWYDLSRRPEDEMRGDIEEGLHVLRDKVGVEAKGFRAPGYTITDEMLTLLAELGMTYDSSVFPCPAYFAAKATAITAKRLRGKRSRSIIDTPWVLTAPRAPYHVGTPYYRPGTGLLEIPIQVTRGARLPFIGTSLALAGVLGAGALARMCVGDPFVNLELHGIDMLDADDGLGALEPYQPDLRVSFQNKARCLSTAVETLRSHGYSFVTMEALAASAA